MGGGINGQSVSIGILRIHKRLLLHILFWNQDRHLSQVTKFRVNSWFTTRYYEVNSQFKKAL